MPHINYINKIFSYSFFELVSIMFRKIRFLILPYLWPLISKFLINISKKSTSYNPNMISRKLVYVLVNDNYPLKPPKIPGINLDASLKNWLFETLKFNQVIYINDVSKIPYHRDNNLLVISPNWMFSTHLWKLFFYRIWLMIYYLRKSKTKVWVLPTDTVYCEYVIPLSFLVAFCGGASILSQSTSADALKYGLIYPCGPIFWTFSATSLLEFEPKKSFIERDNQVLLAFTGERRRIDLMENLEKHFSQLGYTVKRSTNNLKWKDYVNAVTNSRIIVTTCWMQEIHLRGPRKYREKIPLTTLTHRVLEGFASKSVVLTTNCSSLTYHGFEDNKHFLDLDRMIESGTDISKYDLDFLEEISIQGNLKFREINTNMSYESFE
jgi:hypothetical protein